MTRDPVAGGPRRRRDKLVVTGIPPVAGPETYLLTEPPDETAPLAEGAVAAEAAPVFVDSTGGRARLGRRLGLAAGAVLVVFLGALGIGMATGPSMPLTPWKEPSGRPSVKVSRPPVPATEKPDERNAAGRPEPTRRVEGAAPAAPPAPPRSSAVAPRSTSRPVPATSTSRPGKSNATPPAWGRKKKNH